MNGLLSIALYLGLLLSIIGIFVLILSNKKTEKNALVDGALDEELKENEEEIVEEEKEEEKIEEPIVEEVAVVETPVLVKKERQVFDQVNISEFESKKVNEEEEKASSHEEFDMHYYEPLKYDRELSVDEEGEEEEIDFEKRLNYLVKKQDKEDKKNKR